MKRYILFSLIFLVYFTSTIAQTHLSNKFEFGVEGGPNLAVLYGSSEMDQVTAPGFGFAAGFIFQTNFTKLISFRTNMSFERKVAKPKGEVIFTDETGNEIGTGKFHTNYDYIVIPFLLRLNFGNQVKFFTNMGPYFGILLQSKTIGKISDQPDITHTTKGGRLDIGVSVGIGIAISIKERFALSIEARNNLGLLPIFKGGKINTNSTDLLIGISYRFI